MTIRFDAAAPRRAVPELAIRGSVKLDDFRLQVDLTVQPGQTVGVLGPNGAGKTTLLRTLMGLSALSTGSIRLGDDRLDDPAAGVFVPAEHRPVGLVFQNYRLFPHLSVRDNVAFAQRAKGVERRRARAGAQDWLDRLGLGELAPRRPAQLSGGQAQRVALARALAAEPDVLLLDEPLAALDARTKIDVRAELRRHLAEFAGPTILVTHDPLEAMVMTDRLVVFENGVVVQDGTPQQVARRPATQYIARLVGLNLYAGTLTDRATVEVSSGGLLHVAEASMHDVTTTDAPHDVLAAIRPAAIAVHTTPPVHASPRNIWPGVVAGLELLTDRVRVQVDADPPALVDITPDALAELALAEGSKVWISVKANEIDVYPTRGG